MATRALLYRRPYEPSRLLVKHGSQIYSVRLRRHRRARRYTLRIHPSDREAILTMPPRGTIADAKEFAQRHGGWIAARLGRLPKAAPFHAGHRAAAARRRRTGSCIAPASAARYGRRRATAASGFCASRAAPEHVERRVHDYLKREVRRDLHKAAQALRRSARRQGQAAFDPRSVEPLGFVHVGGLAVVLVAADPRPALRARLSRRARSGASGRDEPLGAVLEGRRPGLRPCRARQDLARHVRQRPAPLRHRGLSSRGPASAHFALQTSGASLRGRRLCYRPNSRSTSQPSNPAAGSGRPDVRVGAGRVAAGGSNAARARARTAG